MSGTLIQEYFSFRVHSGVTKNKTYIYNCLNLSKNTHPIVNIRVPLKTFCNSVVSIHR